jgi:hypothetical protein
VFDLTVWRVWKAMAKPVFATLVMYGAVSAFRFTLSSGVASVGSLLLFIVVGILVYGGLVMALYRDGCNEVWSLMQR